MHVGVIHPLFPHAPQNGRCAQHTYAGSGGFRSDRVGRTCVSAGRGKGAGSRSPPGKHMLGRVRRQESSQRRTLRALPRHGALWVCVGGNACCGSWGQFLPVGKPLCPGYLVRVGETSQYTGRNLFPWRGNLRQPARPPKAKAKILTPPQRTHSCSSSCPGRGASRSWGFSGPLRQRSLAAPLAL